jgi:2-polyprenyl-3-methyl-5-hydroxy-6-metoxy-1,4-benzoquinol methylase
VAALYDEDNGAGADHEHFRKVIDRAAARTVADLGCGTGLLTVSLAREGRTVYGIDPSPTMLAIARDRPGGERVRWCLGDGTMLPELAADAAAELDAAGRDAAGLDAVTMTGNVAQHIVGDAWPATLRAIAAALRPGGLVAFESRNPAARSWESWNRADTFGSRDTPFGPLTEWMDVTDIRQTGSYGGTVVTFAAHNVWSNPPEHQVLEETLQFRSQAELTADLAAAGLTVTDIDGGWHGEPVTDEARVLVVTAVRD